MASLQRQASDAFLTHRKDPGIDVAQRWARHKGSQKNACLRAVSGHVLPDSDPSPGKEVKLSLRGTARPGKHRFWLCLVERSLSVFFVSKACGFILLVVVSAEK